MVYQGRSGDRRTEFLSSADPEIAKEYEKSFARVELFHHRRRFRWLDQGTEGPFRRRRHLRPDLQELICRAICRVNRGTCEHRGGTAQHVAGVWSHHGADPDMALHYHPVAAGRPVSETFELSLDQFWGIVTSRRTLNALKISFGLSFAAALVNLVMGTIIVWALVRYRFPGRRLFDAIVDIPFALPTAVAGVALTAAVCAKGLARRAAGRTRHQGRVHADRHFRRDGLHRHSVRGADGPARAARSRRRDRGGGGEPRRQPLADRVPG